MCHNGVFKSYLKSNIELYVSSLDWLHASVNNSILGHENNDIRLLTTHFLLIYFKNVKYELLSRKQCNE